MAEQVRTLVIPAITPEQLYNQDKRRREWDDKERRITREVERSRRLREKRK